MDALAETAENVAQNGALKSASLSKVDAQGMMDSMYKRYKNLPAESSAGKFSFVWMEWAEADPGYSPPATAMEEIKYLIKNFLIGASAYVLLNEDRRTALSKIGRLACDTLKTAQKILKREIIREENVHRIMNIEAISNNLVLTILEIISSIRGSGKAAIRACEHLCGVIETEGFTPGLQLAKPAKHIKRARNCVTQNELADIWRCSPASINTALRKFISILSNCRSDSIITLAETIGIKTCVMAQPPDGGKGGIVWYSEEEACKFLKKPGMDAVPPFCRPHPTKNDGVDWYKEEDLEMAAQKMGDT